MVVSSQQQTYPMFFTITLELWTSGTVINNGKNSFKSTDMVAGMRV